MKRIISVLLVIALAAGLPGCGGGSSSQAFDQSKTYTIKLTAFQGSIWPPSPISDDTVIDEILKKFSEKYPNIKVEVERVERSKYSEFLSNKFMNGDEADLFYIEPTYFSTYASKGMLENLDEWIKKDTEFKKDSFYTKGLPDGQLDNVQYALPRELSPSMMFVNTAVLDNEKIAFDNKNWTWDDLKNMVEKLNKDTNGDGKLDQLGLGYMSWWDAIYSNGSSIITADGKPNFDDPKVREAIAFTIEMQKSIDRSYTRDEMTQNLYNGKYVFFPFKYSYYNALRRSPYMKFKWQVAAFPKGKGAEEFNGVMESLLVGMSARSKNKEAAWLLMKYITNNTDAQKVVYRFSDGLPAMKTVMDEPDIKEDLKDNDVDLDAVNYVVEHSTNIRRHPKEEKIIQVADEEVLAAVEGKQNADQTCDNINRKLQIILQE